MRFSAKTFAAMLIGLALTAFQFDLDAQPHGGSRGPSSDKNHSAKPDERKKPGTSVTKPHENKQSVNKPSSSGLSSKIVPAHRAPAHATPAHKAPVHKAPAHKPPVHAAPAKPSKPVGPKPGHVVRRPAIGSLLAAHLVANTALTIAKLSYYNNHNHQNAKVARNLAYQLGLVQSYAEASMKYYYYDGVFYRKTSDGRYYVIVPPAGALVEELPSDYETIYRGGKEYFKVDNTLYQYTIVDGKPYFEVLGQLN